MSGEDDSVSVDKETFSECIKDNITLIRRAFTTELVIPEFGRFTQMLEDIYTRMKHRNDGKVADYIPQLSRVSPENWGVTVCSVDGQRYSIGETDSPFCVQSVSKPINYALAINDLGPDAVHQYTGHEPSGESFNEIKLGLNNKPHNPMINAGAIVVTSLLRNDLKLADRFDYIIKQYRRIAGGEHIGFNNAVFLSERESADRNYALGYYLKENKCFPEGVNLSETLDFYFQLCSCEATCESASVIAATFANGGICPITGDKILSAVSVRNTLSLMHSCGMYDYSGQWAFNVGLPAKSGVSGLILVVVPNVMGLALWSPLLDRHGNSIRGIAFSEELIRTFNFHNYDNLKHTVRKTDPRRRQMERKGQQIVTLLFGAYNGDVSALRRQFLLGVDMNQADYDGRTALHISAAEGHLDCVAFLIETCGVYPAPEDRWKFTPLDDAMRFNHERVAAYLRNRLPKNDDQTNPNQKIFI